MGNMHLVTGYAGEEHIESNDDRSFHAAFYGNGEYVMDRGQRFAATIISNNKVRVLDGDIMMQGAHIRKKENTYNEVNIENGTQGYMRNDLIGVTYEKDQTTGIETSNMIVIKGEFYEGTQGDPGKDPEYVHGDIVEGGEAYNFMPLYRAELENLTLKKLTPLFEIMRSFVEQFNLLNKLLGKTDISSIGDGTVTGGIGSLNSNLEWKLAGTANGTGAENAIILPISFNEIKVICRSNSAPGNTFSFVSADLQDTSEMFSQGYYSSEGLYGLCSVGVSKTKVYIGSYNTNGVIATGITLKVYFR